MLFNSIHFICIYMVAFLLSYILFDVKYRNIIILLYSFVYYALNSINQPINFVILLFVLLINYVLLYLLFAYYDSKISCNILVGLSIIINLAFMFVFKFEIFGITLPIGFSFYVFHIISCVLDINKYYIKCREYGIYPIDSTRFYNFVSYILFFPKILTGPITRYDNFLKDFKSMRNINKDNIIDGFITFSIGLGLKVLLADNLYYVINQINVFGYNSISLPTAWLGVYSFTMKLYFDFSGYSLMAMGIAKIINYSLPINFNMPFTAISVTDFYRRWHITLMNFFKDYVYIPLGGNCDGNTIMQIRNIFIVWVLTSLWHGIKINYLLWGMSIFIVIALEKLFLLKIFYRNRMIGHIFILIFIPMTFLVFSIENIKELFIYFTKLFNIESLSNIMDFREITHDYYKTILICFLFMTPLPKLLYDRIKNNKIITISIAIIIFILSIHFINILNADTFKYFLF